MQPPTQHYSRDWIQNGQILCFRFHDSNRETADAWFHDTVEVFRTWESKRPLLTLLDVRLQGRYIAAHALIRARQISNFTPDVPGRTAVLISSPVAAQVVSTLIRTGLGSSRSRQRLVFSNEKQAVDWLLDAMKSQPQRQP